MDNIDILQKIIDHIEENLKSQLDYEELAAMAGYSSYHFSRLFCEVVGMPPAAYVTKRRVKHAIYAIYNGEKLIDAALLYGFDTHSGFYKAFKREYGCSPSKYLKTSKVIKPLPINLRLEANVMLTQVQIRQILHNWNVDNKAKIEKILYYSGGVKAFSVGDKYLFTTGTDIASLRTHILIAKELSKKGISISYPVKTRQGEEFVQEGDRYYALMEGVEGRALTPEERYQEDREYTGELYGKAIGNLHRTLKEIDHELEVKDSDIYSTVMKWAMPETKRIMEQWNMPLPQEFYEEYERNFGAISHKLPKQIIHRDPNPTNILFKNGEVGGFIDFHISHRNVRLFDPCYCATGILSESGVVKGGYEKWPEILKGIIKGYDSMCPLTSEEKAAILYVIYSIQMIFIAYLEGRDEEKALAVENRKMLLWIWENSNKLKWDK